MDKTPLSRYLMLNGEIVPAEEARISPEMNGLYHGTGAFETMLSDRGAIFRFEDHTNRLNAGLEYLGFENEVYQNAKSLRRNVDRLLNRNGLQKKRSRVRIQVSEAGAGGYSAPGPLRSLTLITTDELPDVAGKPVRLVTSPVRVVPSACRPARLKLSNMLHYRDAMRRAKSGGADDALMCTMDGSVAESSIGNIFWIKESVIRTPSAACDILPGIMRGALLQMVEESMSDQFQTEEGVFHPDELLHADCVWLTNSVRGLMPVAQLDETHFETDHPAFISIQKKMIGYMKAGSE